MSYNMLSLYPVQAMYALKGASRLRDAPFIWFVSRLIPGITVIAPAWILLLLVPHSAYAHKVNMFAYVEGNKVMMEGYFADGNKPIDCEVIVTNPDKKILVKGRTDQEGKFSFDIPEITDLRIALNAGMGHRTEFVISRDELAGVQSTDNVGTDKTSVAKNTIPTETASTVTAVEHEAEKDVPVTSGVSEIAIRKAVAEANLPLMRAIDELKQGANFSNIIGGIGFIFGIVGLFFYLKARKMLAQSSGRSPAEM